MNSLAFVFIAEVAEFFNHPLVRGSSGGGGGSGTWYVKKKIFEFWILYVEFWILNFEFWTFLQAEHYGSENIKGLDKAEYGDEPIRWVANRCSVWGQVSQSPAVLERRTSVYSVQCNRLRTVQPSAPPH